jgi:hypothetical protein
VAPERDHSGGDADLDAAFAEIIAGWDEETTDPVPRWPAAEDTDDTDDSSTPPPPSSMEQIRYVRDHGLATPDDRDAFAADDDGVHGPPDAAGDARPVQPAAGPRDWELADTADDHYAPPEPPPIPRGDLTSRLAWAGVLLGPLFLLCAGLFWRDVNRLWLALAAVAFIGGFVVLVMRLPQTRDDGDDDGAVV